MFSDVRSKKVILVSHCILNQNAKIDRCALYPGAIKETVELLIEKGIGILQMPCPELLALGLDRQADPIKKGTIETEDDRVAARMNERKSRTLCRKLARDLVCQIEQYRSHGFIVIGVLGINGSPTCGVETNWADGVEKEGYGIFLQALMDEGQKYGICLPARGIKAREPEKAVAALIELISK